MRISDRRTKNFADVARPSRGSGRIALVRFANPRYDESQRTLVRLHDRRYDEMQSTLVRFDDHRYHAAQSMLVRSCESRYHATCEENAKHRHCALVQTIDAPYLSACGFGVQTGGSTFGCMKFSTTTQETARVTYGPGGRSQWAGVVRLLDGFVRGRTTQARVARLSSPAGSAAGATRLVLQQ